MTQDTIKKQIEEVLKRLGLETADFVVEHPSELANGDYSTNVALVLSKKVGKNPKQLAEDIAKELEKVSGDMVEKIEVAGPGFINFHLSKAFFKEALEYILDKGAEFGKGTHAKGFKVMVEHTDPNPFKEFHIGHLLPNVIGTALSNIFAWNGAEVKQANFQGDKGLHVAKAVWAMMKGEPLVSAYAVGHKAYGENEQAKAEITDINKKIYDGSDSEINKIYQKGREESLESFDQIYKRLNTKFDYYFFESETAKIGEALVRQNVGTVFKESEGAIVFEGSHTRVFINSQGLPTYEAKDLGNAKNKFDHYPYDLSVVVTGNEIKDYFKILLEAMDRVLPELAKKTKHVPHGMLRLSTGKMSSRTGNVITAESLIDEVKEKVKDLEEVAVGAVKYMILRSNIGSDIIFDVEKSVSTEGDSGVYLQYAHARAGSMLEKAGKRGDASGEQGEIRTVEKFLYRFPEVVERAGKEYSPHYITTYLTELAGAFNNFYAHEQVISDEPQAPYRLAIVEAFTIVMRNGLTVLGIPAPEKM